MNDTEMIQHLLYQYLNGTAQESYFEAKFEGITVDNGMITFTEVDTSDSYDYHGELIENNNHKSHTVSMLEVMAWVLYQGEK